MSIFTPTNQIRLTNVAIVRLKRRGKRFELACYPNKVLPWRQGLELDLDNVVQSESIFFNVSKGVLANAADMKRCFKTTDTSKVLIEILKHGEIQVTSKERQLMKENLFRDVATAIAEMCVNTETKLPISVVFVERALKEIHFNPHSSKPAKVQAVEVIKELQKTLPIERAHMRISLELPTKSGKQIKQLVQPLLSTIESENWGGLYSLVATIEPKHFRPINEIVGKETKGSCTVKVLDLFASKFEDTE